MALDADDIKKIAHLSRVAITDDEIPAVQDKLTTIMGMIEQMQAVDTSGIEPMAHPLDETQRLRDDVVSESNNREANQAGAPAAEDGLFLVPRVVE